MKKDLLEFGQFCQDLHLSPATVANYKADVSILLSFFYREDPINEATLSKALNLFTLSNSLLDSHTQARRASAVNLFIHFLKTTDQILYAFPSISSPVLPFLIPETTKTVIFEEILKNTDLHNFTQVRDLSIILLCFATGLKLSQLRNLKKQDITLNGPASNVSFQDFFCPIYPDAAQVLSLYFNNFRRFLGQSEYFFTCSKGYQLSTTSITRAFSLTRFPDHNSYLTSGIVRNTFAAVLLENGANLFTVLDILGLSSDTSIQRLEALKPKTSPNF